ANYVGRALKPPKPIYDPEKVAAVILRCAEHPRAEVYVGSAGPIFGALRVLAPRVYERVARRAVLRDHFLDAPSAPTSGNVFQPVPFGTDVHGGWKTHSTSARLARTAVVAAAPA